MHQYILDLASSPRVSSQAGLLGLPSAMRLSLLLVAALAACASAFVAPAPASAISRSVAFDAMASPISMTSANKKAKAATRKQKSSRAAAKRFKVTSTGKLLRHYAGKVRHTTAYLAAAAGCDSCWFGSRLVASQRQQHARMAFIRWRMLF